MASSSDQLKVIALISGGKDSFFSALHCAQNGHRLVALANLFPAPEPARGANELLEPTAETQVVRPEDAAETGLDAAAAAAAAGGGPDDADLNSFMYQTVGHQVIPLFAAATGLPLYRQPIRGGARDEGRDYDAHTVIAAAAGDETESMVPLLQTVMRNHPDANALCAGAILSTYQRTRVESVALRLGLTPLAYLWKFPVLPPLGPGIPREDAQLLLDMAAVGLDARVIKVASAGLDEDFLWEQVSSVRGVARVKKALRRFGAAEGSVLGEGGEFETIVVDGPAALFKKRIVVPDGQTQIVREGGGTSWLSIKEARLEDKVDGAAQEEPALRVPDLLDPRFQAVTDAISDAAGYPEDSASSSESSPGGRSLQLPGEDVSRQDIYWTVSSQSPARTSIEEETRGLVEKIQGLLNDPSRPEPLPTTSITNTIIILRRMADFPAINAIYGGLFRHPNPPSRVTISCGDLLPEGSNIAIHLTVRPGLGPGDRRGLHVQSRSYWAPANIGPYSQVIDVPLFGAQSLGHDGDDSAPSSSPRLLSIAGQIPLWPASMIIPPEADVVSQIVLSLQHLWRIGVDQGVQVWSSAVAYFPRAASATEMRRHSDIAAKAWREAHVFSTGDDDDDDSGPDLWDRKYNSQYMTFGGDQGGDRAAEQQLPDWAVFKSSTGDADVASRPVPPFFAVEVEELPRQSGVEWHAHSGLSHLQDASVAVVDYSVPASATSPWEARVSHTVVAGVPVRSIVSLEVCPGHDASMGNLINAAVRAYTESVDRPEDGAVPAPYLVYLDDVPSRGTAVPTSLHVEGRDSMTAVIPCLSILSSQGRQVAMVALFSPLSR